MSYSGAGGITGDRAHNAPCSNRDFDFFYEGLEREALLVQKCSGCGALRSLPSPACGQCRSLEWAAVPLSGDATIHSYVIHHHPPLPGFAMPHPIVVADMAEGVRLLGGMDGTDPSSLQIGLPIKVEFLRRGDVAAYRFCLA